nr:hypothetical protein [Tanacetum cinerariifolium]
MAPKRTTRSTADQETINATSVTNAQLQAMIDQGVTPLWQHEMLSEVRMAMIAIIPEWVGLPDMIHGSVVASKPKTMQEAVEIATELMDKKIRTFTEHETASKRKFENTSRNTQNQQQQSNKRPNTGRVYTAASGEKKQYGGSKPLCAKCNYHHDGPCAPKCRNYNKISHFTRDCRSTVNTNNANNQRGTGSGQKTTCYECGVQGHFKRECPKLKNNNNHGNQGGRNNAPARVYAVGRTGTDPEVNVVTGTGYIHGYSSPFEGLSDIGSPRANDHEYLMMIEDPYVEVALQAPPSPDYMPGSEETEQAPLSPDYIPGPEHADDEIPLPAAASPTAESPGYIPESDPDEDPEEDPADYPADHDDEEEEEEPSGDDADEEDEDDDDEEEEHPALANSIPPPPALRRLRLDDGEKRILDMVLETLG